MMIRTQKDKRNQHHMAVIFLNWGKKGQRSGGYLVPERTVLLAEGVDLLPQSALCGGPATLLPPQLLLHRAQLLLQHLAGRTRGQIEGVFQLF